MRRHRGRCLWVDALHRNAARPAAAPTRIYLAAIIVGAVVVTFTQVKPVWIVVAGATLGLLVR
jgi:hypothetical protein